MNVDEEALERLTALRLRVLQDRVRMLGQVAPAEQQPMLLQQHLQALQMKEQQSLEMEKLQQALEAKRQQLRQLDDSAREMRDQLIVRQGRSANQRARPANDRAGQLGDSSGGEASKLDAILAQTLQMQTMFMAHMTAQSMGISYSGSGGGHVNPVMTQGGAFSGAMGQPGGILGGGNQHPGGGAQIQQAHMQSQVENIPQLRPLPQVGTSGGYAAPEQDKHLLNQLQGIAEKLSRADAETHEVVEAALARVQSQDTAQNAGASPGKRGKDGGSLEDDEEDESIVEDGDEITHDEMATYHDIAVSWVKKVVKHIVTNVLLEVEFNLEVCAPFKGSFFKKGITQQDVDSRIIKLAVRCKSIVKALSEACTREETPEAVVSFLQRLVAHRQKFPGKSVALATGATTARQTVAATTARQTVTAKAKGTSRTNVLQDDGSYLFSAEREMLKMEEDSERAGEINETQARFLIAHFLFGRIMILQILLEPWKHGLGPRAPPNATTLASLRVISFMIYSGLVAGFQKSAGPTRELSIFQHIGSLPGDENYLLSATTELQKALKVRT